MFTHKPLSSSFLGLPYRILNINHKKELLRGLWVASCGSGFTLKFESGLQFLRLQESILNANSPFLFKGS